MPCYSDFPRSEGKPRPQWRRSLESCMVFGSRPDTIRFAETRKVKYADVSVAGERVRLLTRSNDFLSHCYSGISGRVEQAKRVADVPRLQRSHPLAFSCRPKLSACNTYQICDRERRTQNRGHTVGFLKVSAHGYEPAGGSQEKWSLSCGHGIRWQYCWSWSDSIFDTCTIGLWAALCKPFRSLPALF